MKSMLTEIFRPKYSLQLRLIVFELFTGTHLDIRTYSKIFLSAHPFHVFSFQLKKIYGTENVLKICFLLKKFRNLISLLSQKHSLYEEKSC